MIKDKGYKWIYSGGWEIMPKCKAWYTYGKKCTRTCKGESKYCFEHIYPDTRGEIPKEKNREV